MTWGGSNVLPDAIFRVPTVAEAELLRACFTAARFEDAAVCERLGISSVVAVEPLHVPHYLHQRLRETDPQSALIRLFLLQQPVAMAGLRPALDAADVTLLAELGLVERQDRTLLARIDLYPYDGAWLATDRDDQAGEGGTRGRFDAVMRLNMSSHTLAHLVLPTPVDSALDVGTGCGIHAIRAARHARRVVATDLNPRALRFARFNAALNGVENIEFREGDLWEPVVGETFDLIVANPAFSLSADTELLYRDGGLRGDRMTGALLAGAAARLREGGVALVIGEFPTVDESGFEEQVEGWVGDRSAATPGVCDRLLLRFGAMDPLEYAVTYAHRAFGQAPAEYEEALSARLRQFEALGARDVVLGAVLLRRREIGPYWTARRVLPSPERPIGLEIVRLMRRLNEWETDDAPQRLWEGIARITPGLRMTETRVWDQSQWKGEATRVTVPGDPFCHDLHMSEPARELLQLCDGNRRGSGIAAEFARLYQLPAEEAVEATLAFLQELAVQGLIEVGTDEGKASGSVESGGVCRAGQRSGGETAEQ